MPSGKRLKSPPGKLARCRKNALAASVLTAKSTCSKFGRARYTDRIGPKQRVIFAVREVVRNAVLLSDLLRLVFLSGDKRDNLAVARVLHTRQKSRLRNPSQAHDRIANPPACRSFRLHNNCHPSAVGRKAYDGGMLPNLGSRKQKSAEWKTPFSSSINARRNAGKARRRRNPKSCTTRTNTRSDVRSWESSYREASSSDLPAHGPSHSTPAAPAIL